MKAMATMKTVIIAEAILMRNQGKCKRLPGAMVNRAEKVGGIGQRDISSPIVVHSVAHNQMGLEKQGRRKGLYSRRGHTRSTSFISSSICTQRRALGIRNSGGRPLDQPPIISVPL